MASYGRGSFDQFASYQGSSSSGTDDAGKLAQSIGSNIQKISQNVSQLEKLVQKIGTPQDSEEVRDKVHQTTHYTHQLAKDANKDMQALAHLSLPSSQSEQRQMKMQRERLTEEFSNALKSFQTIQRTAAEKERASINRARAASGSSYNRSNRGPLIDLGNAFTDERDDQFTTPGYSQTAQVLQMENDVDLDLIRERESAIKQLENDIMDVNQIFKDLGMLVHEQGEVLDSIEANVERTEIHVEEGSKQLASARDYQKKSRKKCCILVVILLVILLVLILIIYLATK